MTNQLILAAAVEAAWDAMPKNAYVDTPEQVRAMLEAAAPHMLAAHNPKPAKEGHAMEDLKELIEDGGIIVSNGKLFIQWEDEK